jgi:hypothetical protein
MRARPAAPIHRSVRSRPNAVHNSISSRTWGGLRLREIRVQPAALIWITVLSERPGLEQCPRRLSPTA